MKAAPHSGSVARPGRGFGERELTPTQREIERLNREEGLSEDLIAKKLKVTRRLVWTTLDLPMRAFREPVLLPDSEKRLRERRAAECRARRSTWKTDPFQRRSRDLSEAYPSVDKAVVVRLQRMGDMTLADRFR